MKQAIEEGFIMDVLKYFTPVQSYYKLAKTVEDDPQFDKNVRNGYCATMWNRTNMQFTKSLRSSWSISIQK